MAVVLVHNEVKTVMGCGYCRQSRRILGQATVLPPLAVLIWTGCLLIYSLPNCVGPLCVCPSGP
jgi:hypothetical protein